MNVYLVLRSRYYDHKDHRITDRVTASSMEVKLEESNSIVIFRDVEGRIVGVVSSYEAVYMEPVVTSTEEEVSTDG